jgi:hypothetical protein
VLGGRGIFGVRWLFRYNFITPFCQADPLTKQKYLHLVASYERLADHILDLIIQTTKSAAH